MITEGSVFWGFDDYKWEFVFKKIQIWLLFSFFKYCVFLHQTSYCIFSTSWGTTRDAAAGGSSESLKRCNVTQTDSRSNNKPVQSGSSWIILHAHSGNTERGSRSLFKRFPVSVTVFGFCSATRSWQRGSKFHFCHQDEKLQKKTIYLCSLKQCWSFVCYLGKTDQHSQKVLK